MDKISRFNVVHRFEKRGLLIAINCVAALSIFFLGYDQGVMGGVNSAKNYVDTMQFGYIYHSGGEDEHVVLTNSVLQGGIVAVFYLGTLTGCLLGGWIGDKKGRIKTIGLGAGWAIAGAALQASAQNKEWMICARIVNGIGLGVLNTIVPVWATETAEHTSRGQFVSIEFTVGVLGVAVAYWLEFGLSINYHDSAFRWRFPLGFQIAPLLLLFSICWFFPESPRWLTKVGREDEARYILGRLRGNEGEDVDRAEAEFQDIRNIAELERKTAHRNSYFSMLVGRGSGKLHTGRRVQLVVWLQIIQEWVGIAGVTIYAQTIYTTVCGFSAYKAAWLAGTNNIFYTLSTLVCAFTLDRIGRRWTLYWGSVVQGICMIIAGAMGVTGVKLYQPNPDPNGFPIATPGSRAYGAASAAFIFIFTSTFGATWLIVPWLYPAEIFPLEVRAKGNAWSVVGWSIGNGWLGLLVPVMFHNIGGYTLFIFGAANILSIPMVWAFYPESNQRTLEEMNLLFAADSVWTWKAEKNFALLKEQNPDLIWAAGRSASFVDPETGLPGRRRVSRGLSLDTDAVRDDDDNSYNEKPYVKHDE